MADILVIGGMSPTSARPQLHLRVDFSLRLPGAELFSKRLPLFGADAGDISQCNYRAQCEVWSHRYCPTFTMELITLTAITGTLISNIYQTIFSLVILYNLSNCQILSLVAIDVSCISHRYPPWLCKTGYSQRDKRAPFTR